MIKRIILDILLFLFVVTCPWWVTVIFAVARTVGWVAQWREMITDPLQKIGRPRQLYCGKKERRFIPVEKRGR